MSDNLQSHKYNYGIIGNCAFLALIDQQANVGWMCWPRFDSSFIFGGLLDEKKGGAFSISPEWDTFESHQAYHYNTNVLETTFDCEDGRFKVIDFAPRFYQYQRYFRPLMLIRKIVPLEGTPRVKVTCDPVGEYGEYRPDQELSSSHIAYLGLDSNVRLTTDISLNFIQNEQAFVLNKTKYLVLTWGEPLEAPLASTVDSYLDNTIAYWQEWVRNTSIEQFHQEIVIRSALTLKLHQYQDTGAIIAAATTSLPEFPGSTRNWDYRFCWVRDAHYTIKALNDLSHFGILEDYAGFIQNIAMNENNRYHPLYPIAMDRVPIEKIIPLSGYQGEQPVRIGNQAYQHIQNDIYGQVLVTLLPLFTDRRLKRDVDNASLLALSMHCLKMIEETMEEADNGLWEFRGTTQMHSYTFLFHWAGSHAAKKIAKVTGNEKMKEMAKRLIKASSDKIEACYDEERGVYTQAIGNPNLDASLLQLINMGYLDANSERARKHLKALEKELRTETGLFYRYRHEDDLGEPDSTFLICAFWYVESLARMDRVKEATVIFERLIAHANHLGLLSEDVDEKSGSQWGNFPQTYSHVGLINAAFAISRKLDRPVFMS